MYCFLGVSNSTETFSNSTLRTTNGKPYCVSSEVEDAEELANLHLV